MRELNCSSSNHFSTATQILQHSAHDYRSNNGYGLSDALLSHYHSYLKSPSCISPSLHLFLRHIQPGTPDVPGHKNANMAENGTASQKLDEASGTTTGFEDGMADAVNMNNDRFPQPYSRRKSDLIAPTARIPPLISGLYSHPTERIKGDGESDCDSKSGLNSRKWMSPSESGTEADDESFNFIRALPAPPIKLRKGLRGSKEEEGDLTPTQLDREVIRLSDLGIPEPRASEPVPELEDPQQETRSKRVRRRRGEILRRVLEGALLALSGALVLANQHVWWMLSRAEKCKMRIPYSRS
jgi:hypothetical protein